MRDFIKTSHYLHIKKKNEPNTIHKKRSSNYR